MSLSNPNPFYKRLESRDPKLFQTEIDKKFSAYSRICPSNIRRQPVILNDEEKEYIDMRDAENGTSSYGEFIRYGSPSSKDGKKYNYIKPLHTISGRYKKKYLMKRLFIIAEIGINHNGNLIIVIVYERLLFLSMIKKMCL